MNIEALLSKQRKLFTLVFPLKEDKVLLGLKKRGFGQGKWNGFGGKPLPGESIVEAAIRELEEECGLTAKVEDMIFVGVNHFEFTDNPVVMEVHVFKCHKFLGEVKESEEMLPQWYPKDELPRSDMWVDDAIWFPLVSQEQVDRFRGYFLFQGFSSIIKYMVVNLDKPSQVITHSEDFDGV